MIEPALIAVITAVGTAVAHQWRTHRHVSPGRHRETKTHPGWETAPEQLAALPAVRNNA